MLRSHTRDEYTFDAAYDISRNAAFLSAGKRQSDRTAIKVHITFLFVSVCFLYLLLFWRRHRICTCWQ